MLRRVVFGIAGIVTAASVFGQDGLYLPPRDVPGLDPSLARSWQSPDYSLQRFTTGQRPNWSYSFSERGSLGMSLYNSRELDLDSRQMSLYGRYSLGSSWGLSAETQLRDPGSMPRLQDFRFGVQRRF